MLSDHPEGLLIEVQVQPRASDNAFAGVHDNALKIRLTAPPVDDAANKALIQLLAKKLKWPKSSIRIVAGHTGRRKRLLVQIDPGADFESRRRALKARLEALGA
jgi:uncharacterized protein (TIGR00251 family)